MCYLVGFALLNSAEEFCEVCFVSQNRTANLFKMVALLLVCWS